MAVSKVVFGTTVIVDLTSDTVDAAHLASGYTAHGADGELITGTALTPLDTLEYDYNIGYVAAGTWKYENPTNTYTDIYEIEAGHSYFITLGANVGSRFRAMTTTVDIRESTKDVAGTQVINQNTPAKHANVKFEAKDDGYLLVAKDNVGKTGILSYVYDMVAWV